MAAKYRKIDPRIWNDEVFIGLDPLGKLIALHVLSTQQANRCGIFVFSLAMAEEQVMGEGLGGGFRDGFHRVVKAFGWRWDPTARTLYLPTWWKYNPPESVNVLLGNLKDLEDLPQTPLLKEFCGNSKCLSGSVLKAFLERYPQPYPEPSPIQEQEQEQEQELKTPGPAAGIVPPADAPAYPRKGRAKPATPPASGDATPATIDATAAPKPRTPQPTDPYFDAIAALIGETAAKAAPGRVIAIAKKMLAEGIDPAALAILPAIIERAQPWRRGAAITLNVLTETWPWLKTPPAMIPPASTPASKTYSDAMNGIDPVTGQPAY